MSERATNEMIRRQQLEALGSIVSVLAENTGPRTFTGSDMATALDQGWEAAAMCIPEDVWAGVASRHPGNPHRDERAVS